MTTVAIHQPNYAPWLGYFHKLARADVFVFLDDVQFSKGSYINRVQIADDGAARWLTQPVSVSLGTPIVDVRIARDDWKRAHLDTLRGAYSQAAAFKDVWPEVENIYETLPSDDLAQVNEALITALAGKLEIDTKTVRSSQVDTDGLAGDDRLVAIGRQLAPGGTYLSGKGGGNYQNPDKFASAGLGLEYTQFEHPVYHQGGRDFTQGLSVLDAVFHLGWAGTARLLAPH